MPTFTTEFIIALVIAFVLGVALIYLLIRQHKDSKGSVIKPMPETSPITDPSMRQLQLQAYERLLLLTDRISLPSLIQRVSQEALSGREMQSLLIHSIRQEFEYNITQQMYVSPEAWNAVRDLKEQNLLIINQVASFLPPEATGLMLNKALIDMLVQNPKVSLQEVVSEALSYEARKLM